MTRALAVWVGILALVLVGGCGEDDALPEGQAYDATGKPLWGLKVPARLPNLIVLVVDSLRADALPLEGDPGAGAPALPFLGDLADKGVALRNAVSPSPWTLPAMTSLFTGLLPSAHGQTTALGETPLHPAITTYAEILRNAFNYETAAFVNGHWFQQQDRGILQGFDRKETVFAFQGARERLQEWNSRRDRTRPFFLVLHTLEVHDPYGEGNHPWPPTSLRVIPPPPELTREDVDPMALLRVCMLDSERRLGLERAIPGILGERLQRIMHRFSEYDRPDVAGELRSAYWGGVRWFDGVLRDTWQALGELELAANTLVVVTADHGETFGEHGSLGHGRQLYDELIRIPLVMVGPPPFEGGRTIPGSIGLIDVMPTFFDWAGLQPLADVTGQSFLSALEGGDACRPVLSEERLTRGNTGETTDQVRLSVRTPEWKYIVTYDRRTGVVVEEAYDLLLDPQEQSDLAGETGRLPEAHVFDPCFCQAVEKVRKRIWAAEPGADVHSTLPYGAAVPTNRAEPPGPCRADDS